MARKELPSRFQYRTYGSRLILRDHLANCRTAQANERTLLAYARTALALLAAGFTFIKFFDSLAIEIVGWAFVPVSVALFVIGLVRFRQAELLIVQTNRIEDALKAEADESPGDAADPEFAAAGD